VQLIITQKIWRHQLTWTQRMLQTPRPGKRCSECSQSTWSV